MTVQLQDALRSAASRFEAAGIESASEDAQTLLAHLLKINRGQLVVKIFMNEIVEPDLLADYEALVVRRQSREPLQHITGCAYFRNLELEVGRGVFVPRPETEIVAELAISALRAVASENPLAVDLGTGSGAIALSLATEVPQSTVYAVEKSSDAMVFAMKNFERYGFAKNLVQGDLTEAFNELNDKVSVVVSNPPYIPNQMIPRDVEVRNYDPALALFGGDDGMDVMRNVCESANRLLVSGGTLIVEHADSQSNQVMELFATYGFRQVRAHKDLTGRDRAVTALRP